MLGRTPGNIIAIRPLREGVISDYDMTERMLREFIHKVAGVSFFKPRVIICVPSGITEVEERAVIDAGIQAGARKVYLIEEPVAAAIGAGIDITQPDGHMVVDIGGGTADIAVISLSGVVESASIKIAGDQLNEAVVKYMRRKHNLLVGERTAEEMKKQIGCVFPKDEEETMDVKGRQAAGPVSLCAGQRCADLAGLRLLPGGFAVLRRAAVLRPAEPHQQVPVQVAGCAVPPPDGGGRTGDRAVLAGL